MILAPHTILEGRSSITQSVPLSEEYARELPLEAGSVIECRADFDRIQHQIHVLISYQATLQCECARCLKPFELPVAGTYRVVLEEQDVKKDENIELETEIDFAFTSETQELDIQSALFDELVTAIPMMPLCSDTCPGIALPPSAAGLPKADQPVEQSIDPRWEALKKLKKNQ